MKRLRLFWIELCVAAFVFCTGMSGVTQNNAESYILITVKSTLAAEHESHLKVISDDIAQVIHRAKRVQVNQLPTTDRYLTLWYRGKENMYYLDNAGHVFAPSAREQLIISRKWSEKLKSYGNMVAASHYGALLSWDEVKERIPNKSVITVLDMETGLTFKAQRRAGKHHADVQPLTKADTKVMKQIYQGKWSWKRKAVLVEKDGRYYAASMQGMPHGGDGIPNNGFSGHFCIHFLNSRTHVSNNKDAEHHLMIHKAAGKLDAYFKNVSPYEFIDSFIGAVNVKEKQVLPYFFFNPAHPRLAEVEKELQDVHTFRRVSKYQQAEAETDKLMLEIPVEIRVDRAGQSVETRKVTFHIERKTKESPWKIVDIRETSRE